jgi:hypothetical protein
MRVPSLLGGVGKGLRLAARKELDRLLKNVDVDSAGLSG